MRKISPCIGVGAREPIFAIHAFAESRFLRAIAGSAML